MTMLCSPQCCRSGDHRRLTPLKLIDGYVTNRVRRVTRKQQAVSIDFGPPVPGSAILARQGHVLGARCTKDTPQATGRAVDAPRAGDGGPLAAVHHVTGAPEALDCVFTIDESGWLPCRTSSRS